MTVGELKEKYKRAYWLKCAEDEAISLHHDQRSRGTVPSYGQALAMAQPHGADAPGGEGVSLLHKPKGAEIISVIFADLPED